MGGKSVMPYKKQGGVNIVFPVAGENLHKNLGTYRRRIECLENDCERLESERERLESERDFYKKKASRWTFKNYIAAFINMCIGGIK